MYSICLINLTLSCDLHVNDLDEIGNEPRESRRELSGVHISATPHTSLRNYLGQGMVEVYTLKCPLCKATQSFLLFCSQIDRNESVSSMAEVKMLILVHYE